MKVVVRSEGAKVLVAVDDRRFLELGWKEAEELSRALLAKARSAEQLARIDSVIRDTAILMRAGVPLSLTNDPKALDAARGVAQHDRQLRRAMPSVASAEVVGCPTLVAKPPAH